MAEITETPLATSSTEDQQVWQRWKSEINQAEKDQTYVLWLNRSKEIIARYRDDRNRANMKLRKFNSLWSNIQTLKPMVFSRAPKPIVERRYMDRDPAARLACTVLERVLSFQIETSKMYDHVSMSVDDYLLPGMGVTWVRYDPSFESEEVSEENKDVTPSPKNPNYADDIAEDGDGSTYEKLAYETLCVDHVFYKDFRWGPARTWPEVPWVDRVHYFTKSEAEEKWGKEKASQLILDYTPPKMASMNADDKTVSYFKKAEIHEIWNKADRKVYWIPVGSPGLVLEVKEDPLKLENFWPCPDPMFSTQTTDTVIPVPDYYEYQDQAQELDDLTNRIAMVTTAVRANGVYDASQKGIERLLQEGTDNKLVPVDNWAAYQEKGGSKGVIDLIPMQEIAQVLLWLYEARSQVKADLFEISGISDLVRGQGNPNETATAQRIKGQFASNRLQSKRELVARFCRDTIRIMAEIISEIFTDDTLLEMSGIGIQFRDDVRKAGQEVPQPPPPQLPPEAQQAPPEVQQQLMHQAQMQAQQQYQQQVMQAQQAKEQELQAQWQEALKILRSDKLRGFRVEIETDSTIQPDAEEAKQSATELFTATLQGLQGAGEIVMQAPELADPIGNLLMFVYRQFRVGRTMEASLEESLDKMQKRIEAAQGQPPPPSPEQIKAQAEQQKMQAQMQMDQQNHQLEMQSKQMDLQIEQQKAQMELQLEQQRIELERQKGQMQMALEAQKMQIEAQKLEYKQRDLELQERANIVTTGIKVRGAEEMARIKRDNANKPNSGASGQ
jgi:hypothetical protein